MTEPDDNDQAWYEKAFEAYKNAPELLPQLLPAVPGIGSVSTPDIQEPADAPEEPDVSQKPAPDRPRRPDSSQAFESQRPLLDQTRSPSRPQAVPRQESGDPYLGIMPLGQEPPPPPGLASQPPAMSSPGASEYAGEDLGIDQQSQMLDQILQELRNISRTLQNASA